MSLEREATDAPAGNTDDADDADDAPVRIARDEAYHVLQNGRRRRVLRFLRDRGWLVSVAAIAEHVAAIENGVAVGDLDAQQRKRVYISLYQVHLPKLDEYGIVEYDQSRGTVEPLPLLRAFDPFLAEDDLVAPPKSEHFLRGVSGLVSAVGGAFGR